MAEWIGASIWMAAAVFAVSAAVVWIAGTKLAGYADRFATATGLGGAVVGLVLLGGITSLPEIATSTTAALTSGPTLAVNNLIGGVSFQLAVLAVVDGFVGRQAVTSRIPRADVLAYGAMNIVLMCLAAVAAATGDLELFGTGIGLGSAALLLAYVGCILVARSLDQAPSWRPAGPAAGPAAEASGDGEAAKDRESLTRLGLLLSASAAAILVAGYFATRASESLAEQTGLGAGFFGAVFLAGATSLPEFSSAWAAVRLNRPQLAIGDLYGGNMFNMSLIFVVDMLDGGGPAMAELGAFSVVAAMLGALLAAVFIIGMVERRDRTVLRMGWDSAAVLILYAGGVALLFSLRGGG